MSDATLFSWNAGHGLALETRAGLYEIVQANRWPTGNGERAVRLCNSIVVDAWLDNSRTAARLEEIYKKFETTLRALNVLSAEADPTEYRALYWRTKQELKGE